MNELYRPPTLTADEFEQLSDVDGTELIDGHLKEKPRGAESSYVGNRMAKLLTDHCERTPAGWVFGPETGYRCFPGRPAHVRKPDVSFVRLGRLPDERPPAGDVRIAPDLAVEVVSPNDLYEEIEEQVELYRSAGVRLIWVVSPTSKRVLIRRLDGGASEVGEGGDLDGEDVLPGFRCQVNELFRPPAGVPLA